MVATNYTNFHELFFFLAFAAKKFVPIRVIRGGKKCLTRITLIFTDCFFLAFAAKKFVPIRVIRVNKKISATD
jgi:hypothetical protein